jgi:hypothetical protein
LKVAKPSNPSAGRGYNYAIEPDGFYFIDHLADRTVAAVALQSLLDEALGFNDAVELTALAHPLRLPWRKRP